MNPNRNLPLVVSILLSTAVGMGCDRNSKPAETPTTESATTRGTTGETTNGAASDPSKTLSPCISRSTSNLPGVSIEFPEGTPCSFTLAQAREGLSIPWKLKITEEATVLSDPQDAGNCQSPAEHGLSIFETVGDGMSQRYCICDEGECDAALAPTKLKPGEYEDAVTWDGVNWTGPSDTEEPKGEPFGPGAYLVTVSAEGHAGESADARRFRVRAELPITLSEGEAPDRQVTSVIKGARKPVVAWAGATHKGVVRPANEDRFLVSPELGLYVVADGMGGGAAGEVAAQMTIDRLREAWTRGRSGALAPVIVEANRSVFALAGSDKSKQGMGTTAVALSTTSDPSKVRIANVGDSRIYRLRAGELKQMTSDHSLVQKLVDLGQISAKEAAVHPKRNIITRAIGTRAEVEVDEETVSVRPGDLFLLASDGVHGMITDTQIERVLQTHNDPHVATQKLIELANTAGGKDNIAVVIVRF